MTEGETLFPLTLVSPARVQFQFLMTHHGIPAVLHPSLDGEANLGVLERGY